MKKKLKYIYHIPCTVICPSFRGEVSKDDDKGGIIELRKEHADRLLKRESHKWEEIKEKKEKSKEENKE